jgi:hypothetical protein
MMKRRSILSVLLVAIAVPILPIYRAEARKTKKGKATGRKRGSSGGGGYANCTEARAAGAAPIRRGEAGYSPKLDRDGDGIACE